MVNPLFSETSGGLGILDLQALIAKWWWKLQAEPERPWARLISHHHFQRQRLWSIPNTHPRGSSPFWKGISKTADIFRLGVRIKSGNGRDTLFWKDLWIGEQPLCMAFPTIFEIATEQDATVADLYQNSNWSLEFRQLLSTSRINALGNLLSLLKKYSWKEERDTFSWALHPSGSYTVKSTYIKLKGEGQLDISSKCIWSSYAPLKTKITLWLALKGALLTVDVLARRNISPPFLCHLCSVADETANHLFLICPFSKQIWHFFCDAFRLPPVPPDLNATLSSWRRRRVSANIAQKWDCTVAIIIWCIWMERNARIFVKKKTDLHFVIAKISAFSKSVFSARTLV